MRYGRRLPLQVPDRGGAAVIEHLLIRHEGLRLKPYLDTVGKLTIGVGRNLDDMGISEAEALHLLRNDIETHRRELGRFPWFQRLDDTRQAVILNMHFNLGAARFNSFRKMIECLEEGDYVSAAGEMLNSRWAAQVGDRARELSTMMMRG